MPGDALFDVDVSLDAGALALRARLRSGARRIALVGPSGAGKTTLLRVLAGLERRVRGSVRFDAEVWHDGARSVVPAHRRRVGWVPQDVRLFPHRTVEHNLRFAGAGAGEAAALADRLGIGALLGRRPRHLSGGEAQRVAIARALLARPRLLLLDEPFAALDRSRRAEVSRTLLEALADTGAAIVLVTHDDRDVASLAEEVFEMTEGALSAAGSGSAPR